MGPATPISREEFVTVIAEAFRGTFEDVGPDPFASQVEAEAFISRRLSIFEMGMRRGFTIEEIAAIEDAVLEEIMIDQ